MVMTDISDWARLLHDKITTPLPDMRLGRASSTTSRCAICTTTRPMAGTCRTSTGRCLHIVVMVADEVADEVAKIHVRVVY